MSVPLLVLGQKRTSENLPSYDEKLVHYGFLFGGHISGYRTKYSDLFLSAQLAELHAVVAEMRGGFKLGFIVNFHLLQYLDLRLSYTVGFYDYRFSYEFLDGTVMDTRSDLTLQELPILLKYRSVRRDNHGVYLLGGVNISLEVTGKEDADIFQSSPFLRGYNIALETGIGVDIYFPYFKFSTEVRYAHGLKDQLLQPEEELSQVADYHFAKTLTSIRPHNVSLFITFEGGPNYFRKHGGNK